MAWRAKGGDCFGMEKWRGCWQAEMPGRYFELHTQSLMIGPIHSLIVACDIALPGDTIMPKEIIAVVIYDLYSSKWQVVAGWQISLPEFSPGLCQTRHCSNLAFMYTYCVHCHKWKYHVEVKKSTLKSRDGKPVSLSLFAAKTFLPNTYICDYSYDMGCEKNGFSKPNLG